MEDFTNANNLLVYFTNHKACLFSKTLNDSQGLSVIIPLCNLAISSKLQGQRKSHGCYTMPVGITKNRKRGNVYRVERRDYRKGKSTFLEQSFFCTLNYLEARPRFL